MRAWAARDRFTDFELDLLTEAVRLVEEAPSHITARGKVMVPGYCPRHHTYTKHCGHGHAENICESCSVACHTWLASRNGGDHEIRCHELARAVLKRLKDRFTLIGWEPRVVDGQWNAVAHSWIAWRLPQREMVFLDVYTPGAVPQVQLLDASPLAGRAKQYVVHPLGRYDIKPRIVQALLAHWDGKAICTCDAEDSEEMTGHAKLCALVEAGEV